MRGLGYSPAPLRGGGRELLESAVAKPSLAQHFSQADVVRQAAVLAVGISQAQAFLDGNKRTAMQAMTMFLLANGRRFTGDRLELADQLIAVATREDSLDAATDRFETWIRQRVS